MMMIITIMMRIIMILIIRIISRVIIIVESCITLTSGPWQLLSLHQH